MFREMGTTLFEKLDINLLNHDSIDFSKFYSNFFLNKEISLKKLKQLKS